MAQVARQPPAWFFMRYVINSTTEMSRVLELLQRIWCSSLPTVMLPEGMLTCCCHLYGENESMVEDGDPWATYLNLVTSI